MVKNRSRDDDLNGFVEQLDETFRTRVPRTAEVTSSAGVEEASRREGRAPGRDSRSVRDIIPVLLVLSGIPGAAGAFALHRYMSQSEALLGQPPPSERQLAVSEDRVDPVMSAQEAPLSDLPDGRSDESAASDTSGVFVIQVALCSLRSCVEEFQQRLSLQGLSTSVEDTRRRAEHIELYTRTGFATRESAVAMGSRLESEYGVADRVEMFSYGGQYHLVFGPHSSSEQATRIRDALNLQLAGKVTFGMRVTESTEKLNRVVAGRFQDSLQAAAALNRLVRADSLFSEAYIVRKFR